MPIFKLQAKFKPAGDQSKAIKQLVSGLKKGLEHQTLLGVTGSGKTFTMANVVTAAEKPTLVIAHNKTLAAQLAQEYRDFFPKHAVHYFVSYYDYYQPEAYLPITDTYIEKDAKINEEIDRLRHASTQALLSRRDVLVVASVSCIYGLGSPSDYEEEHLRIRRGEKVTRNQLIKKLVHIYYTRTNADLLPGQFRAIGSLLEIMPPGSNEIFQLKLSADGIDEIVELDPVSRIEKGRPSDIFLFPAKHFITSKEKLTRAVDAIKEELADQLKIFGKEGKILEAERLKRRTTYDLAMLREVGYCHGIENYSRHLSGREAGEPPDTLLSYFPRDKDGRPDFLTVIDESHVTVPQLAGMFAGDQNRKRTLIEHGFRLPSALDNRPLTFDEFNKRVGPIMYTSATPARYEIEKSGKEGIAEQIIRPTGLVDPVLLTRPIQAAGKYLGQVKDFIIEAKKEISEGGRVLVTTLTKKMAEELADYLVGEGVSAKYLHSDIKTLERVKILTEFRQGKFDCLVGVNLLREGLDLPEVTLIGILDADKEGFLRSEVSLIQIIGRAARNTRGRVILYADVLTESIKKAMGKTARRRKLQLVYNKKHKITPRTISKHIKDITETLAEERHRAVANLLAIDLAAYGGDKRRLVREKRRQMNTAVKELDFETAAILRDEIKVLTGALDKKEPESIHPDV